MPEGISPGADAEMVPAGAAAALYAAIRVSPGIKVIPSLPLPERPGIENLQPSELHVEMTGFSIFRTTEGAAAGDRTPSPFRFAPSSVH